MFQDHHHRYTCDVTYVMGAKMCTIVCVSNLKRTLTRQYTCPLATTVLEFGSW